MSDQAEIQQILNLYSDGASRRDFVQMNAPGVIMIDGDRATACTTIREVGRYSGRDELFDCAGTYDDAFVRTAEGWRFAHRRFETHGISSWAVLPGGGKAIEPG